MLANLTRGSAIPISAEFGVSRSFESSAGY